MSVPIRVARLEPGVPLPVQAHEHDAGYDLAARVEVVLEPGGGRALVPTGLAVAIPPGHAGFVLPRSGLALRHGVTVLNSPGTVDADYRGEVMVLLVNLGERPFQLRTGDRIAQLVVARVARAALEEGTLGPTRRGAGGYGHTGV